VIRLGQRAERGGAAMGGAAAMLDRTWVFKVQARKFFQQEETVFSIVVD
jgi:hypothetical protein